MSKLGVARWLRLGALASVALCVCCLSIRTVSYPLVPPDVDPSSPPYRILYGILSFVFGSYLLYRLIVVPHDYGFWRAIALMIGGFAFDGLGTVLVLEGIRDIRQPSSNCYNNTPDQSNHRVSGALRVHSPCSNSPMPSRQSAMRTSPIVYDLNRPGQNYDALYIRLRELGFVKVLYSQSGWRGVRVAGEDTVKEKYEP